MEPLDLVPNGYRFLPKVEELVVDYLANWIVGTPIVGNAVVFTDVYGTKAWNLLGNDHQERYFFAEHKPKKKGGSSLDMTANIGSWIRNKESKSYSKAAGKIKDAISSRPHATVDDDKKEAAALALAETKQ
ncbi:hypothetical protein BHE74_00058125 [Ensete ventricosum]|nr:hypothetical protein GW17_00015257 [Ensete ventricosum]RWW36813.1 hypothetical protein BHE74_00058125 [Ensete ventricosum]RZS27799.1 hypothetical protein BHM03_00061329 [Ensete ventricosum]